jgi:hypothetical protein
MCGAWVGKVHGNPYPTDLDDLCSDCAYVTGVEEGPVGHRKRTLDCLDAMNATAEEREIQMMLLESAKAAHEAAQG